MSDDSGPKGSAVCHLLVTTAGGSGQAPLAWLARSESGWQLPSVEVNTSTGYISAAEPIREALYRDFRVAADVLCCLSDGWTPDHRREELVTVVDAVPATVPPAWQPLTAADLATVPMAVAEHHDLAQRWLRASAPDTMPRERVAWARPGWRRQAEAWINAQLAALGLTLAGPLAEIRHWSLSGVLRVPTPTGDYFFKAVPPLFRREPALTDALSRRHPGQAPQVVAQDSDQGWMLMRGFGGEVLRQSADPAVWEAALRGYAQVQIAWRDDGSALRRLGCPDRDPPRLREQVDDLLTDTEILQPGTSRDLTGAELAELQHLAPRLKTACLEWSAAGLAATLEHGDLHANNIAVGDGQFVYFDWSDGCIAHPFVCLATFLEGVDSALQKRLTLAYAECWRDHASATDLAAALRLSRPLGALHLAVSYREIQHATEPMQRWQLAGSAPFFLRQVLKHKDCLE